MSEKDDGIRVEAVEIQIDYDELFTVALQTLEQMLYEFRHRRGVGADGQEEVGVFARFQTKGTTAYTARSTHAGHIAIDTPGTSIVIDFSNPDETLRITREGKESPIGADAEGVSALLGVQRRLVELDLGSLTQ